MLRVVLAAAITALMGASLAAPAGAATAGKATGGGSVAADEFTPFSPYSISFNAHAVGNDGAKGNVHFNSEGGVSFVGDVTCYLQVGNQAFFAGEILHGTGGFDSDEGFFAVSVQDSGEGSSEPDLISFIAVGGLPLSCGDAGPPLTPLASGNIQVHPAG